MVTLQVSDSRNERRECQIHENNLATNIKHNESYFTPNELELSTNQVTVDDPISIVDNGELNNSEIINTEDDENNEIDVKCEEEKIDFDTMRWMEEIQHETSNGQILPNLNNTNYGEVCVTNSTNVRVGNTTLYKGPVTIKQFVYTNSNLTNENGDAVDNGELSNNLNCVPGAKEDRNCVPTFQGYDRVKSWLWTWNCAAIMCILGLIFITVIVVLTIMLTKHSEFFPNFSPAIDPDDIITENIRFIQRYEWGAQPPEEPLRKLNITPTPYVIISHTASEACHNQAQCIHRVRLFQTMHIEGNHWSDIAYNFLIGGDGLVYVGRGWDWEGAHAFGFNSKSIGISLIGTFNKMVPPARQIHTLVQLIAIGVKNGKIDKEYKLLGHRQVSETLSPGDVLYSIIKTWDHWSEKP